nr:unnamed protein product [Callosobruchus analis]
MDIPVQWCVVCFDDGIQLVPKSWIAGTKCFWPTFTSNKRYEKTVKYYEEPEDSWPLYNMRILGTYDSYEIGKRKLKIAEDQSDLSTDDYEKSKKMRSLKKKRIFSSSDDDSDMDKHLEPFPQMPKKACINKDFLHTSDFVQVNQNSIDTLEVPCSVKESPAVTPEVSRVTSFQPRISEDDFRSKLVKDIAFIKIYVTKMNQRLDFIEEKLSLSSNTENVEVQFQVFKADILPISSTEELDELELKLREVPNFKQEIINYFAKIGGYKVNEIVKLILRKLMSNYVASLFSWQGKSRKRHFAA